MVSVCAVWLAAKTYLWSREIKTLEDAPGKLTVVVCFSVRVIQQGVAAVARAVDRAGLLFRHILDRQRIRSRSIPRYVNEATLLLKLWRMS